MIIEMAMLLMTIVRMTWCCCGGNKVVEMEKVDAWRKRRKLKVSNYKMMHVVVQKHIIRICCSTYHVRTLQYSFTFLQQFIIAS